MLNINNKKKLFLFLPLALLLCGVLTLTGFGLEADKRQKKYYSLIKQTIPIITARQLENLLSKPSPPVLLDTRQYKEYYVSHLTKTRSVGYRHFSLTWVKDLPTPMVHAYSKKWGKWLLKGKKIYKVKKRYKKRK